MKEEKYLILLIILISLTVISVSFAYFSPNIIRENITDTKVNSGKLKVDISDDKITADNIAPIYDKDVTNLAFKKDFSIISNSTLNSCNKLYLDISNISEELKSEYLKYMIVSDDKTYEGNFKNINDNKLVLLDNIFLGSNEVKNYKLYIWLSYQDDINQIDMLGTSLTAKISIESFDEKNNCIVE